MGNSTNKVKEPAVCEEVSDECCKIRTEQTGDKVQFKADNRTYRPLTLVVTVSGDNIANATAPFEVILEPQDVGVGVGEVWRDNASWDKAECTMTYDATRCPCRVQLSHSCWL